MANDCTSSCLIGAPSFDVVAGCGLLSNTRSGYIKGALMTRCDVTLTDISSASEIESYLSAGTMFVLPPLTGTMPFPSLGDEIQENCETPVATKQTYQFNFDSYRVDNTNLTDSTAWETVRGSLSTWRIAPITCDDIILVRQDFGTGETPGFKMGGTIATVYDNSSAMIYRGELSFNYEEVIKHVQLTDAVVNKLDEYINGTIT